MINIIISITLIIIGLIGIWKTKFPKFRVGPGYAAEIKFYILFYGLVFAGILSLIIILSKES